MDAGRFPIPPSSYAAFYEKAIRSVSNSYGRKRRLRAVKNDNKEQPMSFVRAVPEQEFQSVGKPVLDTMIELAHARQSHRVVVAGSTALDIYAALCRRGFCRVATATHHRTPGSGGCDVAFIAGYQSFVALEAALLRVAPLLNSHATIAIWVNVVRRGHGQTIQRLLQATGFVVQSGAKCENGFVLAARRHEGSGLANVA